MIRRTKEQHHVRKHEHSQARINPFELTGVAADIQRWAWSAVSSAKRFKQGSALHSDSRT